MFGWRSWAGQLIVLNLAIVLFCGVGHAQGKPPHFTVSFPVSQSNQSIDGRLLLLLSNDPSDEPRMQINDSTRSQMVFGVDVDGMRPGQEIAVDETAFGYPVRSLRDVPGGDYYVQVVLHRYETFHRADGHTIKLPVDRGEGQHWNLAPGNLYSTPRKISVGAANENISIVLEKQIAPIPVPQDTKYIRHLKIQSQLLSKFWGRPTYLSANVLLPEGFGHSALSNKLRRQDQ